MTSVVLGTEKSLTLVVLGTGGVCHRWFEEREKSSSSVGLGAGTEFVFGGMRNWNRCF